MEYDKNSFLSGLSVGRALRGAGGGGGGGNGVVSGIPMATSDALGGIKAAPIVAGDGMPVHIDENGFLWVGSGGSNPPVPVPPTPDSGGYYTGVYGVKWLYGTGSKLEVVRLQRANDPNGLVGNDEMVEPAPAVNGEGGSSPFDEISPWADMQMYDVSYKGTYLKKEDGGFALSGKDVNVMVWIPPFYYRVIDDGVETICYYISSLPHEGFQIHPGSGRYVARYNTGLNESISTSQTGLTPRNNQTRATFREEARFLGNGWYQYDVAAWSAVSMLYLVEYASLDSQTAVGSGYVSGSSALKTGATDEMTYHTGSPAGEANKTAVQYRWIENPWGSINQFVDGWVKQKVSITQDNYSDTEDETFVAISAETTPYAMIPNLGPHKISSIDTDSESSSNVVLYVGGYYGDGSSAGMWCASGLTASYSYVGIGSRLLYIPPKG